MGLDLTFQCCTGPDTHSPGHNNLGPGHYYYYFTISLMRMILLSIVKLILPYCRQCCIAGDVDTKCEVRPSPILFWDKTRVP